MNVSLRRVLLASLALLAVMLLFLWRAGPFRRVAGRNPSQSQRSLRAAEHSPQQAFGIKVTLVEPGAYATEFGKSGQIAAVLEPYAEFRKQFLMRLANLEWGDPRRLKRPY